MTSIYRQIGIGCEKLFRRILRDSFNLTSEDVIWSYGLPLPTGKLQILHLDGRVPVDQIDDTAKRKRFQAWMHQYADRIGIDAKILNSLSGAVFEVRQGYKSKDAKRQHADIANAATSYIKGYLPCAIILSAQIDGDILLRYRQEKWAVLIGLVGSGDPLISTYDFM